MTLSWTSSHFSLVKAGVALGQPQAGSPSICLHCSCQQTLSAAQATDLASLAGCEVAVLWGTWFVPLTQLSTIESLPYSYPFLNWKPRLASPAPSSSLTHNVSHSNKSSPPGSPQPPPPPRTSYPPTCLWRQGPRLLFPTALVQRRL